MRTCIKAWMSLNLGQIPLLTMELAALERLKNQLHHFFSVAIDLIRSFPNLQVMRTCIISWMSSNFGQIWPPTTELAALSVGKNFHRLIMGKTKLITFSWLFLIGSFPYLQVMRTYIKAYISLNFGQIQPLSTKLAALERLKNRCNHIISVDIDPIFFKLAGNKDMHNIMKEFEFRPDRTTDYGVSWPWASKKYPHRLIIGKMVFPLFLLFLIGSFWYFHVTRTSIKAWMSSNFRQIRLLTMELAALERLKHQCLHFF